MAGGLVHSLSESTLRIVVSALTIVVIALVSFMLLVPGALSLRAFDVSYAPPFHAFLNASCAILLSAGYIAIRSGKRTVHRTLMLSAFGLSCVFLVSYVIYHSQKTEPTHFHGPDTLKLVYFGLLISHIILAAGIVPLALYTIVRSWRGEFQRHRKIARITFPLWLYVTISGVLVYFMLYVWFPTTA